MLNKVIVEVDIVVTSRETRRIKIAIDVDPTKPFAEQVFDALRKRKGEIASDIAQLTLDGVPIVRATIASVRPGNNDDSDDGTE